MYRFKYRKRWIWRTIRDVAGHKYLKDMDRMDVILKDGSILSIAGWSGYDMFLGTDWVLFTKALMEEESGQDIKLKAGIGRQK